MTSNRGASVALRVYIRDHLGELISPGQPLFIFADQIPGVVAALNEAATIFAAPAPVSDLPQEPQV